MTTDITELAQRVKTEASAIDDTQWYLAKPSEIRSLVEALELKEEQRIAELENYAEAEAVGADKAAENSVYWMKCCKELESRTVKLPEQLPGLAYASVALKARDEQWLAALTAAGIKWEAE